MEKAFSYKGLTIDEIINHLTSFVSRLWQIHIFGEGNTRTTDVFFIKYLRTIGFYVTNDVFAQNAWYFRNALIRANYTDLQNNIHETYEYLELFLRNLLLDEKNELHNRYLHIKYKKVDIESIYPQTKDDFSTKTSNHIRILFMRFGFDEIFGRNMVMELLNLKSSGASKFISALLQANIIEPVLGQGKGKYKFKLKR